MGEPVDGRTSAGGAFGRRRRQLAHGEMDAQFKIDQKAQLGVHSLLINASRH